MGLQSKRTGQVVRGLLIRRGAAGDGLVALSATLILPVQTHWAAGRAVAGQWIYAKQSHAATDRKGDKQARQIQPLNAQPAAQPCEETWGLASTPTGWRRHRHRSRGRATLPATLTPAPERRAAAAGRCTPRRSRGTLNDGRCRTGRCAQRIRPEPCGGCSAPGNVQELHQQHAPVGAMDPHQARLGSTLHARTLLAHLLGGGQNPHPAAGHEVFAACLKGL